MHFKQQIKENEELRKFYVLRLIRAIKQLLNEPFNHKKNTKCIKFSIIVKSQCESIYWISEIRSLVRGRGWGCGDNTVIICRSISTVFLHVGCKINHKCFGFCNPCQLLHATYTQMNPTTFVCMISSSPDSIILIEIKWCSSCKPIKGNLLIGQLEWLKRNPRRVYTNLAER